MSVDFLIPTANARRRTIGPFTAVTINLSSTTPFQVVPFGKMTFKSNFGSFGTGNGELTSPGGISVRNGNVFIADTGNDRIAKFTSDGSFVVNHGSTGTGNAQFDTPTDVDYNNTTGHLYVVDQGNNRIQKLTDGGVYVTEWSTGARIPYRIASNAAGTRIYVTERTTVVGDSDTSEVREYDNTGVYQSSLATNDGSTDTFYYDVEVEERGFVTYTEAPQTAMTTLGWGSNSGTERIQRLTVDNTGGQEQWSKDGRVGNPITKFQLTAASDLLGNYYYLEAGIVYMFNKAGAPIVKHGSTPYGTDLSYWYAVDVSYYGGMLFLLISTSTEAFVKRVTTKSDMNGAVFMMDEDGVTSYTGDGWFGGL
jgi:hypothetical protein